MKKVFIAGPYTNGDVAQNVKKSMDAADDLIENGFAPLCPHLTHFLHMNNWRPYETWLNIDSEFLKVCDAVLRIEGKSAGADREVGLAKKLGIPVFYSQDALIDFFLN